MVLTGVLATLTKQTLTTKLLLSGTTLGSAAIVSFSFYKIAKPDQVLIKYGAFCDTKSVNNDGSKKTYGFSIKQRAFVFPIIQRCRIVSIKTQTTQINVECMSSEKLPLVLPVNIIIQPVDTNKPEFLHYVERLTSDSSIPPMESIEQLIVSVIRQCVAKMSIEEIFSSRTQIQTTVLETLNDMLISLGIKVLEVAFRDVKDDPKSKYFGTLRHLREYEAEKHAETSRAEQEAETKKALAIAETVAVLANNEQRMIQKKSETEQRITVATLESEAALKEIEQRRSIEIEKSIAEEIIEQQRRKEKVELQRRDFLSKQIVDNDIELSKVETEAMKLRISADAEAYSMRVKAEAKAYSIEKEGDAEKKKLEALAEGYRKLTDGISDPTIFNTHYLGSSGILSKISEDASNAIRETKPTVYQFNSDGKDAMGSLLAQFGSVFKYTSDTFLSNKNKSK